jgi:hypothetical protein
MQIAATITQQATDLQVHRLSERDMQHDEVYELTGSHICAGH